MAALEQIARGAQQQAAATQQSSAAIAQIERGAQSSQQRAQASLEKAEATAGTIGTCSAAVEELITGVQQSRHRRPDAAASRWPR